MSDIVPGFEDTNLNNILPLRWVREKQINQCWSSYTQVTEIHFSWTGVGTSAGAFKYLSKWFSVQPGMRATIVCKENIGWHFAIKLLSAWSYVDMGKSLNLSSCVLMIKATHDCYNHWQCLISWGLRINKRWWVWVPFIAFVEWVSEMKVGIRL